MDKKIAALSFLLLLFSLGSLSSCAQAAGGDQIVLKKGETLWTLAEEYGLTAKQLLEANHLTPEQAKKLAPGDTVLLPSDRAEIYRVEAPYPSRFISAEDVRLRTAPQLQSDILTHLSKNKKVYMLAFTDSFVKVKVQGGGIGWVARRFVQVTRSNEESYAKQRLRREIVLAARSRLGARYHWGASGNGRYDCSGLTLAIFKKFGLDLPHSAAEQFREGKPVAKKALQPGDLVFFTTYKPGASHVGIYIGNGQFIHASTTNDRVKISSLSESYYRRRYIGARRLLH